MTTPIPDEFLAKSDRPFEPSLPPELTVGEALSRWRDARAPRYEPLLAAGELHGVMPQLHGLRPRPPKGRRS